MQFSLNRTKSKELSNLGINQLKSRERRTEADYAGAKSDFAKQLELKRSSPAQRDVNNPGAEGGSSVNNKKTGPEAAKAALNNEDKRAAKEVNRQEKTETEALRPEAAPYAQRNVNEPGTKKLVDELEEEQGSEEASAGELLDMLHALMQLLHKEPAQIENEGRQGEIRDILLSLDEMLEKGPALESTALIGKELGLTEEEGARLLEELKALLDGMKSAEIEGLGQADGSTSGLDTRAMRELLAELGLFKMELTKAGASKSETAAEEAISLVGEAETEELDPTLTRTQYSSDSKQETAPKQARRELNPGAELLVPKAPVEEAGVNVLGLNTEANDVAEIREVNQLQQKLSPSMKPDVFEQVRSFILREGAGIDERSEMVIRLKPEELGRLELKIELHNDEVTAKFQVASQQVKEALEANLEDLKMALKDKGFEVSQLAIDVRDGSSEGRDSDSRNMKRSHSYLKIEAQQEEMSLVYQKSLEATVAESTFEHLA